MLNLLDILSLSSTGKYLIKQARIKALDMNHALIDLIKPDEKSITDSLSDNFRNKT